MMFFWLAGFYVGCWVWKHHHWTLGLLTMSVFYSGSQAYGNKQVYVQQHQLEQLDMSSHASRATLVFLLCLFIGDKLRIKTIDRLLNAFLIVGGCHCLKVFYQYFYLGTKWAECVGFLPNVSMGPCMLACLLPLSLGKLINQKATSTDTSKWGRAINGLLSAIFTLTVIVQQSSIGWASYIVGFVVFVGLFLYSSVGLRKSILLSGALLGALGYCGRFVDSQWYGSITTGLQNIDRLKHWEVFFQWWVDHAALLFGTGVGTFRHLGPVIQKAHEIELMPCILSGTYPNLIETCQHWQWAHSDWLQILFENGIIGLLSAFLFLVVCLYRTFQAQRFDIFAALVAYTTAAAGNYPGHLAEYATLGMLLFTIAMKLNPSTQSEEFSHVSKKVRSKQGRRR